MKSFRGTLSTFCALLAALVSVSVAAAAGPQAEQPAAPPARADGDHDRIFDDLEGALAAQPATARVSAIVVLRVPATAQKVSELQAAVGAFALRGRFTLVPAFSALLTKAQIGALAARPDVLHVEGNAVGSGENADEQSSFGLAKARLDGLAATGDADGNPAVYSSGDMVAAVLDTGIDQTHRDLDGGKVLAAVTCVVGSRTATPTAAAVCAPQPAGANNDDSRDSTVPPLPGGEQPVEGHGTHVASILAGDGDALPGKLERGVAPGAALVDVKVLPSNRALLTEDMVVRGLEWVVANRVLYNIRVVNLSLGFPGCNAGDDAASLAVDAAAATGLLMVVAAGNDGPNKCTVKSPGTAAAALTVGNMADLSAVPAERGFRLSDYISARGPTQDGRIKPDVVAPGLAVTAALAGSVDGYRDNSGTSMSSPFVAGLALLMLQTNTSLSASAVKSLIMSTAEDWGRGGDALTRGSTGPDVDYGAGRLDAYAALRAAGAPLPSPPRMPTHLHYDTVIDTQGASATFPVEVRDTSFPIAATLIVPFEGFGSTDKNFFLYLHDPTGAIVASDERIQRQKDFGYLPPLTGTYTVEVRAAVLDPGQGNHDFFLDVSAGTQPPPDTAPPVLTVPGPLVVEATGPAGAAVSFTVGSDDGSPVTCTPPSGSTFPLATTTVGCSSTDAAGNTGTGSFTVSVRDTTPPALALPADITRAAPSPAGTAVTWTASASDLVSGARPVVCTPASGSTFPVGTRTVACSASDAAGNLATGTFRVTVTFTDTVAPVLTVPADLTREATGPAGAAVAYAASATDAVDGPVTPTCTPPSGSTFPLGTTTVSCTARDGAGNTATRTFRVIVRDTTPPTLTLPGTIAATAASAAGVVVTYAASARDLVGGSVPAVCVPASGSTFPVGDTTVRCSAVDSSGNRAAGSFLVRVAADPIALLRQQILQLPPKVQKDLLNRLDGVLRELARGKDKQTCKKFDSLVKKESRDADRYLSGQQAARLDAAVDALGAALGC